MHKKIDAPDLIHTFLEAARLGVEAFFLPANKFLLSAIAPRGNGAPVLVLPGIMNDDLYTKPLRDFLTDLGYHVYRWEGGLNTGFRDDTAHHLRARLDEISRREGKKVALVGHSLGGIYARELARAFPDKVSKVITLCSPFGVYENPGAVICPLRAIFCLASDGDNLISQQSLTPPPVPTTSVFSRSDGMVSWESCLNPLYKETENIEVSAGHLGVMMNAQAFLVVADRLAEPVPGWQPFDPSRYDIDSGLPQPYTGEVPPKPWEGAGPSLFF